MECKNCKQDVNREDVARIFGEDLAAKDYCSALCYTQAVMRAKLRPVRFGFDDDGPYEGFTDGSTWNGWLNVSVTPETHAKIVEQFRGFHLDHGSNDFDDLEPGEDGLVSYANFYTTSEWEDDEPTPYQKWVDSRHKHENLGDHVDGLDECSGLLYEGGSWIKAAKGTYYWKFSTLVGNQEFESPHLGAVEWWLWNAWVSDQQDETPKPEPMNRKIVISSCNGCSNQDHSGAFTQGGAIPLCHGIGGKGPKTDRWPDEFGSVLPFESVLDTQNIPIRNPTGEIPDWCPLPRDSHE